MFDSLHNAMNGWGIWSALLYLLLFVDASILMIWRQEAMTKKGVEGTALGTLIMPYCSGLGNLMVVFVLLQYASSGANLMESCIVNNVTNMTLLIGLPTLIWGMAVIPVGKIKKKEAQTHQLNRISLLATLSAVFFFTGAVWVLGLDGKLDRGDGLALIGLFVFWQAVQVFDVMKSNVQKNHTLPKSLLFDLLLIGIGGLVSYFSIEGLVEWLKQPGRDLEKYLGWFAGWLNVLPNALMAFYYALRKRSDIVYSSQVGDGHICIPLCIGLFAIFQTVTTTSFTNKSLILIVGATLVHFIFVATIGRLPRFVGALMFVTYLVFVARGLSAIGA